MWKKLVHRKQHESKNQDESNLQTVPAFLVDEDSNVGREVLNFWFQYYSKGKDFLKATFVDRIKPIVKQEDEFNYRKFPINSSLWRSQNAKNKCKHFENFSSTNNKSW